MASGKTTPGTGGWVKWEKALETDPRFLRLMRVVRDRCVTGALSPETKNALAISLTAGCLLRLWAYADTHIRADDVLDLGPEDIDDYVGVKGFSAALPEDWLEIRDESHVQLPNYQTHNGVIAKKRALDQKRQENKRTRDRHAAVTHASRSSVTPTGLDQTRPDQTRPEHTQEARAATVDVGGDKSLPPEPADGGDPPTPDISPLVGVTEADRMNGFEGVMAEYPAVPRWFNRVNAERNCQLRIERNGETWETLRARARAYRDYCTSGGVSSPAMIRGADSFFEGDDGPWRHPWKPITPSEPNEPVITWRPPPDDGEEAA
jgi:hypothetical protein